VDEVISQGLHEYIDSLQMKMNQVGSQIRDTFFAQKSAPVSHRPAMAQMQTQ
jgi:uncharacterized alpha-E superfamily protein